MKKIAGVSTLNFSQKFIIILVTVENLDTVKQKINDAINPENV